MRLTTLINKLRVISTTTDDIDVVISVHGEDYSISEMRLCLTENENKLVIYPG